MGWRFDLAIIDNSAYEWGRSVFAIEQDLRNGIYIRVVRGL
jgi:hypothetical protein